MDSSREGDHGAARSDLARTARDLCRAVGGTGSLVVVNTDDLSLALDAGANGLHLRESAFAGPSQVRLIRERFQAAGRPRPVVGTSASARGVSWHVGCLLLLWARGG